MWQLRAFVLPDANTWFESWYFSQKILPQGGHAGVCIVMEVGLKMTRVAVQTFKVGNYQIIIKLTALAQCRGTN